MFQIVTVFYYAVAALAVVVLAALIHIFWNWYVNTRDEERQKHLKPRYRV
jgi:hypothetical protein